jgi:hypothetical protein
MTRRRSTRSPPFPICGLSIADAPSQDYSQKKKITETVPPNNRTCPRWSSRTRAYVRTPTPPRQPGPPELIRRRLSGHAAGRRVRRRGSIPARSGRGIDEPPPPARRGRARARDGALAARLRASPALVGHLTRASGPARIQLLAARPARLFQAFFFPLLAFKARAQSSRSRCATGGVRTPYTFSLRSRPGGYRIPAT